jgi:hypothetical protein
MIMRRVERRVVLSVSLSRCTGLALEVIYLREAQSALNLGAPHRTPQHTMFLNGPGPADVSRLAQSRDDRLIIHPRGLFNPSDRRTTAEREAVNSNDHAYFGQILLSICPIDVIT